MKTVQWRRLPRHGNADPGVPLINDGALVMALGLARVTDGGLPDKLEAALVELNIAGSADVDSIRSAVRRLDGVLAHFRGLRDCSAPKC